MAPSSPEALQLQPADRALAAAHRMQAGGALARRCAVSAAALIDRSAATACARPPLRCLPSRGVAWGATALQIAAPPSAAAAAAGSRKQRAAMATVGAAGAAASTHAAAAPAVAAPAKPLVLVVAVVLIDSQGRVLLAQRPPGKKLAGLWEFPGGKVDEGEGPEVALARELHEELGIAVEPVALVPLTFASHAYESFHLLMPTYVCREWRGEPHGAEGQALAWVTAAELEGGRYDMPPADVPLLPPVLAAMQAAQP